MPMETIIIRKSSTTDDGMTQTVDTCWPLSLEFVNDLIRALDAAQPRPASMRRFRDALAEVAALYRPRTEASGDERKWTKEEVYAEQAVLDEVAGVEIRLRRFLEGEIRHLNTKVLGKWLLSHTKHDEVLTAIETEIYRRARLGGSDGGR